MHDLAFIEECSDQIIQCRQFLKWSYVVGYFADDLKQHELDLFKDKQGNLDFYCDNTHEILINGQLQEMCDLVCEGSDDQQFDFHNKFT